MKNKQVDVLGITYKIIISDAEKYPILESISGYCDETTKECLIDNLGPIDDYSKGNLEASRKQLCRHELTHAFLYESGLGEDSKWAMNEEMVDWIARQFPKMLKAFKDADCL